MPEGFRRPDPKIYIRKSDGAKVHVIGCTGSEWNSEVTCWRSTANSDHTWHVRLENFWKKYEEKN